MALKKRTVRISGHNTSVALEPQFWEAVTTLAGRRGKSVAQFIASVDAASSDGGLASALRVTVLHDLMVRVGDVAAEEQDEDVEQEMADNNTNMRMAAIS